MRNNKPIHWRWYDLAYFAELKRRIAIEKVQKGRRAE